MPEWYPSIARTASLMVSIATYRVQRVSIIMRDSLSQVGSRDWAKNLGTRAPSSDDPASGESSALFHALYR